MASKDQQINLLFVIFAGLLISLLLILKRHQDSERDSSIRSVAGMISGIPQDAPTMDSYSEQEDLVGRNAVETASH